MKRHPIEAGIEAHGQDDDARPGVDANAYREALSVWAATVTVVAVRDEGRVHATTVTSFFPVSREPPLVAISLGPNAQPLPWLDPGASFTVSFLAEGQRRLASDFADSLPVGPSPFADDGDPVVEGSVMALVCTVREVHPTEGGAHVVVARVENVRKGGDDPPLLYQRRAYRRLAEEE